MAEVRSTFTPSLRFPDFSDEWKERKLGDIAKFSKGKNISKSDIVEDGEVEAIRYGELYTQYKEVIDDIRSRIAKKELDLVYSDGNDLLMPASGETSTDIATASHIRKRGVAIGGDINIIRTNNLATFMAYYLNNAQHKNIARLAQGNSVVHLYSSQLKSLTIKQPSLEEQKKIADFLISVDEHIESLERKYKLLEQYKKGMMQQIFSQQIRFKDDGGSDYPEWGEKELGSAIYKNSERNKNSRHTLVQSVSNKFGFVTQTSYFDNRSVASADLSNYFVIRKGAFAYNPSRINVGSLAYKEDSETSVVSPLYISFTTNKSLLIDRFMLEWFDSNSFMRQMDKSFEGSVRNTLSYGALSDMVINLPKTEEQYKIANFLESINGKIELSKREMHQSKQFKKALLQQMFV